MASSPRHFLVKVFAFFTFLVSKHCSFASKQQPPLVFPLKTQELPYAATTPRNSLAASAAANKLLFHHNVSLTVSLTVGYPPQNVTMVLDTGSELSWLLCRRDPNWKSVFVPRASKTYVRIPCTSATCRTRTRTLSQIRCDSVQMCHFTIGYADSSSIDGQLAFETFRIGSSSQTGIIFGCVGQLFSSNKEEDAKTTGLMGMNLGSLSFVKQIGVSKFSYCISGIGSTGVLLLGDATFSWLKPLSYTPLVSKTGDPLPNFNPLSYSVQLEGIKVNNRLLNLPRSVFVPDRTGAGHAMVDSGTQFSFLMGPVYDALRKEFLVQTRGILRVLDDPNFVFQGVMDLCYLVEPSRTSLPELPVVTLMFQGAEMSVSGERLLYRVPGEVRGSDWVYCFTFGNSDMLGISSFLIGNHHQQNMWMEYDLERSRIGFTDVHCDRVLDLVQASITN